MKLKGKIAIITGGSGGIGKAIAEFFVREGARVVILAGDSTEISSAILEIAETTDKKIEGVICDVGDTVATMRVIRRIGKRFRKIDILVNCAAIQAPIGSFITNAPADWKRNIEVNLFGTMAACKAVLPFMIKRRTGVIINFAGGGATSSRPNFSAYATAKIGVIKFTEILGDELKPYHIRVNAVSPGAVNTFMLTEVLAAGLRAGKAELIAAKKRFKEGGVSPEVAAALVAFLASNKSRGLTGRVVSAQWDDWKTWDTTKIKKIMATDRFTLRRVA